MTACAAGPALQGLAGIADILLGRHEDEHIAPAAFVRDVGDRLNGKLHVARPRRCPRTPSGGSA